jgi:hypothetical protein
VRLQLRISVATNPIAFIAGQTSRFRVPAALLLAFLQRTPALRVSAAAAEGLLDSPAGAMIRAAAASIAALGAVDSVAGATIFMLTTGIPGHPSPYEVTSGSQVEAVGFAIATMPITQAQAGSWSISGNIPPGLMFGSPQSFLTAPGTLTGIAEPDLFGTPTTPGTYTMTLEAFQGPDGTERQSGTFNYEVIVAAGGAPTPTPTPPPAGSPAFTTQPLSVTVAGGTVALYAAASHAPTYQWMNGPTPVAGATTSILKLADAAASAGTYTCVATNAIGSATSTPATVSVGSTSDAGRLINLSTRAQVGTGGNILIVGFAVGGTGAEPLLARASGPALDAFNVPGALRDPQLQLFDGSTVLATNNGWAGNPAIVSEAAQVGAFTWTDPASHDSALATQLGSGSYTAQVAGQSNDTGVSLAEIYDATNTVSFNPGSSPHLVNLSARVMVGTGGNILIAGFVIGGSTATTVLIRASGPALAGFGVAGALSDPELTLSSGSAALATNNGWGGDPQIAATAASVGAFSWGASPTADSALLLTLPPGAYTAQVAGAGGDTGISLVEVYEVP